jgi:hypothetical protein
MAVQHLPTSGAATVEQFFFEGKPFHSLHNAPRKSKIAAKSGLRRLSSNFHAAFCNL